MRKIGIVLLLLIATGLSSSCSFIQRAKILTPESFGLSLIAPGIYMEVGADAAAQNNLREAVAKAEDTIRAAYGSLYSHPIIHACITEHCYQRFGEHDSVAAWFYYGDRILLSPRGLNWHLLTHEWSHAELRNRLNFWAWQRVPRWFDEGIAVALSEAPEHSEAHWQYLIANQIPQPTRQELYTLVSFEQWIDALNHYGDGKGEPKINPVYAAAGHELRPWLASVRMRGLLAFIQALNDGAAFELTYHNSHIQTEMQNDPESPNKPKK